MAPLVADDTRGEIPPCAHRLLYFHTNLSCRRAWRESRCARHLATRDLPPLASLSDQDRPCLVNARKDEMLTN